MFRVWGRVGKFVETAGDDAVGAFGGQVVVGTVQPPTKGLEAGCRFAGLGRLAFSMVFPRVRSPKHESGCGKAVGEAGGFEVAQGVRLGVERREGEAGLDEALGPL